MAGKLPQECDILIVGAGPTGMALAAELARLGGSSVLIVDQLAAGANESRAAVIHARTLEVLEPLGIVPDLLAQGLPITTFRAREHDRVLLTLKLDKIPSAYQFALLCPQDRTELVLRRKLEVQGQPIVRPSTLRSLNVRPDGVDAQLEADGALHRVRAAWVVGCDGGRSAVRTMAGIGFQGGSYEEDFVLADVRMDWPLGQSEGSLFFSPEGMAVVIPFPGDHFRVVATVAEAKERPDVAAVQRILDTRGPASPPAKVHEVIWSSRFHIHHCVADTFCQGRVLLCGDAAHVHSPAGGQGMNTGIQDAVSLGQPLVAALSGGTADGLLQWATARRRNAQRLVAATDRLTRFSTARSPLARRLRNLAMAAVDRLPPVSRRIAISMAELDLR